MLRPGQHQKPGPSSRSPSWVGGWVAGTHVLQPPHLLPRIYSSRKQGSQGLSWALWHGMWVFQAVTNMLGQVPTPTCVFTYLRGRKRHDGALTPCSLPNCYNSCYNQATRSQEPEHQSWPPAEWEGPEPAGLPPGTCVSTRLDLRLRHSDEAMRLQFKKKKISHLNTRVREGFGKERHTCRDPRSEGQGPRISGGREFEAESS